MICFHRTKRSRPIGRERLLHCQILDPFALPDHPGAQSALEPVCGLNDEVQEQDVHVRKTAQAESQGHADNPHEAAVEEKGDQGLAAGAESEIRGIGVGIEGHHETGNAY